MSFGTLFVFLLLTCLAENAPGRKWRRRATSEENTVQHESHQARDRAVYVKCRQFLNLRHQSKKENFGRRANQPLGPLCRQHMDKFMQCFQENIYNSSHPYDVVVRTNTNFYRIMNATTKLCEDYKTYKPDMSRCLGHASRCVSRPHFTRNMFDSDHLCSHKKIRCDYDAFSRCDIKGAMMTSRYFHETNSNGCILTDPLFQLFPQYGPELGCYSFINMEGMEYMNMAQVYDHFCKGFDVFRVLSCIEERLPNITSDQLLEDHAGYISRAKAFARNRHHMCDALWKPENYDCMRDGEAVDITSCDREMFISPIDNDRTALHKAVERYAECVFDKYNGCNPSLAAIIRDNLMTMNNEREIFTN